MLRDDSGASMGERGLAEASLGQIAEGKTPGWVPKGKLKGNGFGLLDASALIPQVIQAMMQSTKDDYDRAHDVAQERELEEGVFGLPEGATTFGDREMTPEGEGYKRDGYSFLNYVNLPEGIDGLLPESQRELVGTHPIRGRDLAPSFGGDWKVPIVGWNFPDSDSIIGLFLDSFGDPLNGLGKGGVVLKGLDLGAGAAALTRAEARRVSIKVARQSKGTNAELIVQNWGTLAHDARLAMNDSLPNILKAVREGNVSRAVRVARAGDGGFTITDLRSLGVQTNLTHYGREIAGTESAVNFLGRFALGIRMTKAEREAASTVPRASEALARKMEGLKASAVEKFRTDMLSGGVLRGADGKRGTAAPRSEWETFTTTQLNREAGNRANGALMQEMADVARSYIDGTSLARKVDAVPIDPSLKGRALERAERKAADSNIPRISDEVISALRSGDGELKDSVTITGVYDAIGTYTESAGMLVADMTPTTMRGLMNDESVPLGTRMLVGPVVLALKAFDLAAMTDTKIADGVGSHTVDQLVGPGGVIARGSGTIRQMLNNVAVLQVAESILTTGRLQLGAALFNAADNADAVIRSLGLDTAEDYLLKAGHRSFSSPAEAAAARDEVLDLINSTKSPGGYVIPIAYQQQLARAGSTNNLLENSVADAVSLARTTTVMRSHWDALELFFDEIHRVGTELRPKPGGRAFTNTNKQYGEQAIKDARKALTQDPRTVLAKVRKLIRNGWHNPDIVNPDKTFPMFSEYDRAFLAVVSNKYPRMIGDELSELSGWLRDVENAASRFKSFDETLGKESAEFSKAIDTWYHQHTLTVRMFGPEAVDALNGQIVDGVLKPFESLAHAQIVADRVIDINVNVHGLTDRFGAKVLSPEARTAYGNIEGALRGKDEAFDFLADGVVDNHWAGAMLDSSEFLNSLGRADAGNDSLQSVIDYLSKYNRVFKSQGTSAPGFFFRNFGGAAIMNYYRGNVVVGGEGGYRDFGEVWDTMRKALRDESQHGLAPRTSRYWEEIGGRKSAYAGPEDLGIAQKVAYSGQIQSGGATGDPLDFAFELDEATIRHQAFRSIAQFTDRYGARNEAATVGLQRRLAEQNFSPRRVGDGTFNRTRYSRYDVDGLSSSARETTETYMRGAQMWSAMKKDGYGLNAALERVASTHFDYWDFANGGKVADIFMPFLLFKARMTAASVDMATQTPGMLTHIARLDRAMQEDRVVDPDRPYTIGAGIWRGMGMGLDVSDPRVTGLSLPSSVWNVYRGDETIGGFTRKEVVASFNPLLGFAYDTITGGRTEFGRLTPDGLEEMELIEGKPGFTPHLLRAAGVADGAISVLTEALGAGERHPLLSALERTGHFGVRGGELWGTDTGMAVIGDILPILGQMERLARQLPWFKGRWNPDGDMTEAEWDLKVQRQAYNSLAAWTGFQFEFYSPDQEAGLIRSAEIKLELRNRQNQEAWTMREAMNDAEFQEEVMKAHKAKLELDAALGD
jgi:hypothetical protein